MGMYGAMPGMYQQPGPGMMMGQQPFVPPRAPAPQQAAVISAPPSRPEQQTAVYVGKIPAGLPDSWLKELLETCGAVTSWDRVTDPSTAQPKSFGFCKFGDADGVLRALRLLNGLEVDTNQLLLKVDQKTQAYLDSFEKERGAAPAEPSDESVREAINELVEKRPAKILPIGTKVIGGAPMPSAEEQEAKEREREEERRKQREREDEEEYRRRERDWHRRESDKEREYQREASREEQQERESARRVAEDEELLKGKQETFEQWWSKYQKNSFQRRRAREREEEQDNADRRREKEELEAAEKKRLEEEAARAEAEAKENEKKPVIVLGKKPQEMMAMVAVKRKSSELFEDDENKDKKKKLIPLEYTEAELKARDPNYKTAAERAEEAAAEKAKRVKAKVAELVKTIPSGKDELFGVAVDWEMVKKANLIPEKLHPWVTKKIAEFLGEEEASMIQFVIGMLDSCTAAAEMIPKLAVILEDDAESFVIKMWRMLVFEMKRWEIENAPEEEEQPEAEADGGFSLLGALMS